MQSTSTCGALKRLRSDSLLRLTSLDGTILPAVTLTVFARRTDDAERVAQPAIEQSPDLRLKARTHRWSRNRIRFLDNPPAACDTPQWRVARSVRSPGRLGGQDRAFNAFSGPSNYSGSVKITKFPRLSRAISPVKESEHQGRSSPTMRGSMCPATLGELCVLLHHHVLSRGP